jgi:hypothetical protein
VRPELPEELRQLLAERHRGGSPRPDLDRKILKLERNVLRVAS